MDEQNMDNQIMESLASNQDSTSEENPSQQIPGLDPFAPQPEQRIITQNYDIEKICYFNQQKTLYKVDLVNGEIHFLAVNGEGDLSTFIGYQIEDGLLTVENYKIQGVFYNKLDATVVNEVDETEESLYTTIIPLTAYNDGTTQAFNDTLQAWEYTFKGEELLSQEYANELEQLKSDKIAELSEQFNDSKLIVIEGNYTIEIYHNTPERDIFLTKIEQLSREDIENNTVVGYSQEKNSNLYKIALVPYIWKYIYTNLFLVARTSGFKESIRDRNKQSHKEYYLKIQNSATKEAVNDIEFVFINPNGIVINVDDNAQNILNDPTTPSSIIGLINQIPLVNGRLNLITEKVC